MEPSIAVLITGANGGVGFASSRVIASSSGRYHVFVTARTLEKAQGAVEKLKATGQLRGTVSALQLDQTDPASVARAAGAVEERFGRLDVLVNNGAVAYVKDDEGNLAMGAASFENAFKSVFEINVVGPFTVSRVFRPLLDKSADPRSVYISSIAGSIAKTPDMAAAYASFGQSGIPYAVSKAALNMVGVVEKVVHAESKIKMFAMCPGYVVSNLRGTGEDARTGWGDAGNPDVSGRTLLSIIEGARDEDEGKGILHKDGVYPW
ncbi:hypothetical protein GGTG_13229 [Gaeumannomyces tritici R3-111a-1]|uniref:Short chain dehydrogenase n=1 Tax=Gaeumannomyces tritici (strain R3-111a-1) TaxID=644352 RepID=J3PIA1_GAET3|nr:hypothetical protein GGTG_13229 [Gaeumannomyces tritici R3-111a-1]EJT69613.1 hypothetical protein GGTG_13229 [Gaeumannomyces tritici R3-111a-1]